MGHVGRHGRNFWIPLGFSSGSAACAPSASTGNSVEVPLTWDVPRACILEREVACLRCCWGVGLPCRHVFVGACCQPLSLFLLANSLRVSRPRLQSSAQGFICNRIWISLRSGTSGLHGMSTLFYPCSCPLMEAVNKLGVPRAPLLQSVQAIYRRLNNSGRSTLRVLPIGGTTEFSHSQSRRNPRSPDFKHKVTGKALWIDGWHTPAWVKAKFKLVAQIRLESDVTYTTKYSQGTAQGKGQPKGNDGGLNTVPESGRALGQIVQGGGGSLHEGYK